MTSKKQVSSKKKISPSKVKEPILTLRSYGFDKKHLKQVAKDEDFEVTNPSELYQGRKHKRTVNKELLVIKRVHTDNKRSINQFKKDIINHDADQMQEYLNIIMPTFNKLSTSIANVEEAVLRAEQGRIKQVNSIIDLYSDTLLRAKNEKQCEKVVKLMDDDLNIVSNNSDVKLWPKAFQDLEHGHVYNIRQEVDNIKLRAALKIKSIKNGAAVKPDLQAEAYNEGTNVIVEDTDTTADTELIDGLSRIGGHTGWKVNIGFNGVSIYQDPSSTLSLRAAMKEAINDHKKSTI